ncbi:MAG: cytochrome c oxidase subunit II, partial [Solirubrobacteraceae bacterium]
TRWRRPLPALAAAVAVALAGCGDNAQNALDPHSEPARQITTLWWWMLVAAVVVFGGVVGLLGLAYVRRGRRGLPFLGEREDVSRGVVLLFGIAIPIVALIAVFTVANFAVASKTDAPPPRTQTLTIQVVGRQWWWEIRYPGTTAITANELHIPVRTHVNVVVRSADVIHSFWVPELNRKIDMIPGQTNRVELYADAPGRYEGQCAEYCGVQHAHMRLAVFADAPQQFLAWRASAAAPRAAPATTAERRGERVFLSNACAACHQIRGTPAVGQVGPDLTHLATRSTLAALTIPNTGDSLLRWIRDPQHVKPGNRMPGLNLSDADYRDLLAYLRSLR